jgi:large subunit ribosomal protein L29
MKPSELRAKDVAALEKEVDDLLRPTSACACKRRPRQLTNHSALGKTRRDIARAKTILNEKKKGAAQ